MSRRPPQLMHADTPDASAAVAPHIMQRTEVVGMPVGRGEAAVVNSNRSGWVSLTTNSVRAYHAERA
ncbi:MAG: hypothetical protein AB7G88_13930 [Thermomicrobiales bacterium]